MGPLEQLLQVAAAGTDAAAVARAQREGSAAGAPRLLALAAAALQRRGGLPQLLDVLLARDVQGCCGDTAAAEARKAQGNVAFRRQELDEAVRCYTEALQLVDETTPTGSALAATLYCNRALCLLRLSPPDWGAAVLDAGCAIACDPLSGKAWFRRASAKQGAGDVRGALEDAQQAQRLQQRQTGAATAAPAAQQPSAAGREVADLIAALEGQLRLEAGGAASGAPAPPPTQQAQQEGGSAPASEEAAMPPAATAAAAAALAAQCSGGALSAGYSAASGRFLTAAWELPAGQSVLREPPFALALTRSGRKACCDHCGGPLPAARWFCRACPLAQFCSPGCREAERCHWPGGPECGAPWTALLPAEAVLALRGARALCDESLSAAVHQHMASLETHFEDLDPAEAAELAALALVTHAAWQGACAGGAAARQRPSAEDVLRTLCQVRVNGVAVVPPARGSAADRLALALYPAVSLMNHACRPNVSLCFEGATAVVRPLKVLPPGAPLLHCYGPQQGEMSWAQRQAALRRQYGFACSCTACAGGPSDGDVALVGLRCPHCCPAKAIDSSAGAGACGSSGSQGARCNSDTAGAVEPPGSVPPGLVSRYALEPLPPQPSSSSGGSGSGASSGGSGVCITCGSNLSQGEWSECCLPQLQRAAQLQTQAEQLLQAATGDFAVAADGGGGGDGVRQAEEAVRLLQQCLEERQRLLHPLNQLVGETHDALARALHAAGRPAAAAAAHLRASLALVERHYPPGSTATAFQKLKLAALLRPGGSRLSVAVGESGKGLSGSAGGVQEAAGLEGEAAAALALHFGAAAAAALVAAE